MLKGEKSTGPDSYTMPGYRIYWNQKFLEAAMQKKKIKSNILLGCCVILAVVAAGFYAKKYVSVNSTVNGRELPIYSVDTGEKKVALSFDAAWGNEDTRELLDILKKHQVHVTFFMTGGWVEKYPEDVKAILAAGHDLGNHSENHKNMSQLSEEEIKSELMKVHDRVKELTGYDMFLFRPPYGDYDNEVIETARACGYYPIQWSVDSLDWKDYGADDIIRQVCDSENLTGGAIILCHNGAKYTADALDAMLTELKEKGYEVVPVSELIIRNNYHMDPAGRQIPDN